MGTKVKELKSLLKKARQALHDWCDEYGHHELKVKRDQIDYYFGKHYLPPENVKRKNDHHTKT